VKVVNGLRVLFTNADCLMNKRSELENLLSQYSEIPDVIGIVEVKPKNCKELPTISEFQIKGYDIHDVNVDRRDGRGIILYTAEWLKASPYYHNLPGSESVWVEVRLRDNDKLLISCIYRSPTSSITNNEDLNQQICMLSTNVMATHILIMGDFNYPNINWKYGTTTPSSPESSFLDAVNDSYLHQHVTNPTRARANQCPGVLDLVLTNEENMLSDLQFMAPLGKSDHAVLSFELKCYTVVEEVTVMCRQYHKGDFQKLRNELAINWDSLLDPLSGDAEAQLLVLHDKLNTACDSCIPCIKRNLNPKHCRPPMNSDMRKLIRRKNRLWTRYIETKDTVKYKEYCMCRNKVRGITRTLRKEFEYQVALRAREEPKNFWNYANSKLKTRSKIPDLYVNADKELTTNDYDKVEVLSDFFASVYVPKSNDELPILQDKDIFQDMELPHIDCNMVEKHLKDLKVSKTPGPDGIHPRVLKELASVLAIPLAKIFQTSIDTGHVPQYWKLANVTPVFKKGNKKDPANYRPISLTCIVSKILEKIVSSTLIDHLRINKLLSNKQFGFLKGRSTNIQMICVMNDWTKSLNEGTPVDIIYLDYMKAFDKVSHRHLLHKLQNFGIHHHILKWIQDFLNNRSQIVRYNKCASTSKDVISGIPQGTVIGPNSFIAFVNDVPDTVSSTVYMFADDTKMYNRICDINDHRQLQMDINKLDSWSKNWCLMFNSTKCKVMSLGRSRIPPVYTMSLCDGSTVKLECTNLEKDLGIMIDSGLTFVEHMHMVSKKANGIMAVIRRTFTCLDIKCFNLLYKALVRSHLEYGVTTWFPYKVKDIEIIESVQKRATKQVKLIRHLHYSERLRRLNLPTLRYRRHRGDMIEVFKILHKIYDIEITEGLLQLSNNTTTRGHSLKLSSQPSRIEIRRNSFSVRVVKPWNSLPQEVVMSPSVKAFEARLDRFWKDQPMMFDYKEELRL